MGDYLMAYWVRYGWGLVWLALPPLLLLVVLLLRLRWKSSRWQRLLFWVPRLFILVILLVPTINLLRLLPGTRSLFGGTAALVNGLLAILVFITLMILIYVWWRQWQARTTEVFRLARIIPLLIIYPLFMAAFLSNTPEDNQLARLTEDQPSLLDPPPSMQWDLAGTGKEVSLGPSKNHYALLPGAEATSRAIWVEPGQTYHYAFRGLNDAAPGDNPEQVQIRLLWQDAALRTLPNGWEDSPPTTLFDCKHLFCPDTLWVQGSGTAPPVAAYLRVVIRQLAGASTYNAAVVWTDAVRVEPFPNRQQAALAFSFDWESAMGGPIHSKGDDAHNVADATRRGLAMRQGADFLQGLFARYAISGTFYATGYNLLDGNTERRQFAGNPTYPWAKPKWGWPTDYWTTHPWYGDDPFGTAQTDPAWYFGDQASALRAAGQEIGSHTFGHLYVRGSNPRELDADLSEWDRAAAAKGLPPVQTFAFPWQSSNSLTAAFDAVFSAHGIRSLTRLYPGDLRDHYALGAIARTVTPTLPSDVALSVMPDFLLGPSLSPDSGDAVVTDTLGSGLDEARGTAGGVDAGKQVIDTVLARHGVTSFWNHPEQLAETPAVAQIWSDVVAYAAGKRSAGLWIAPVSTIANYMRDMRQVEVVWRQTGGGYEVIATNHTDHALDGVTLTFPIEVRTAMVEGQPAPQVQDYQVVLPRLAAGATVTVQAK